MNKTTEHKDAALTELDEHTETPTLADVIKNYQELMANLRQMPDVWQAFCELRAAKLEDS